MYLVLMFFVRFALLLILVAGLAILYYAAKDAITNPKGK